MKLEIEGRDAALVQLKELDTCGRDNAGFEREVSTRSRKVLIVFWKFRRLIDFG
jgi:hypothetical protein